MSEFVTLQSKKWDCILEQFSVIDTDPEKEILEFLKQGPLHLGNKGLDIGCGFGRHTLAALKIGFNITAVDFSEMAVKNAAEFIKSKGFKTNIYVASMDNLPFKEGTFDFTFSSCVFNHGTRAMFEEAIFESVRVLRSGGTSFGLVMSRDDYRYGKGIRVERDCYVFLKGLESGVYHFFPSKKFLQSVLKRVSHIVSIQEVHYIGNDIKVYHPELQMSSHFIYCVRKP